MSELHKLSSFLESVKYGQGCSSDQCIREGIYPFVTISRQTGAGGHTLSETIIRKMQADKTEPLFSGWKVFDRELCEKMTEESGLNVVLNSLLEKEYHSQLEDIVNQLIVGVSAQDAVLRKMFQLMRTLATFGKVILVGRGGVCLTRSLSRGIHIRLTAPLSVRVKRVSHLLQVDEKKTREMIMEQDKARAQLVKTFFGKDVNDPLLYDAVLNTESLSMDEASALVMNLIAERRI